MKNISILIILLLTTFATAQESSLKNAIKQMDSGVFNQQILNAPNQVIENNLNIISPKVLAEYYYKVTLGYSKAQDTDNALSFLKKLTSIEGKTYYSAKNKDTKKIEYFWDKEKADSKTNAGNYTKIKSDLLPQTYGASLQQQFGQLPQQFLNEANGAYKSQNYTLAAQKYYDTYSVLNTMGQNGGIYRFNSALSYHQAKNYDQAIALYKEMIDQGYTGIETTRKATLGETGNETFFESVKEFESAKKLGIYSNFVVETTPSKEKDLYTNLLQLLSIQKKYEEAIPYLKAATQKFPDDSEINKLEGNIYYNTGNSEKFIQKLESNIEKNPNDVESHYNLGVLLSQNENASEEELIKAKQLFEKSIAINPNYTNAYLNLTNIILRPDSEYVRIINSSVDQDNDQKRKDYKVYTTKRKELFTELLPHFEKLNKLTPNDYFAVSSLYRTYKILGMFDKEDQIKPLYKKLKEERRAKQ